MRNLMRGGKGRWLAMEALPAYLLILGVWPLISGFASTASWEHGFVLVFSTADCAAVAFCFLIAAFFDLGRFHSGQDAPALNESWWVPFALAVSLIFSIFIYIAVKLNPIAIDPEADIPNKAYFYCALSWCVAVGTSILVYHSKR